MGAVDFRSDKERIAAYTKAGRKQARSQTKLMSQQLAMQRAELAAAETAARAATVQAAQTAMPMAPADWYPNGGVLRYWDGCQWTNHTHALPAAETPKALGPDWLPS
jgi:hypothetical protein